MARLDHRNGIRKSKLRTSQSLHMVHSANSSTVHQHRMAFLFLCSIDIHLQLRRFRMYLYFSLSHSVAPNILQRFVLQISLTLTKHI